ncbi:hypothetical protein GCM10019016_001450 [Streptomyces prasinosporus]|uniref:Uncharacterized protein n=1 Tax=Streptomyces prasinosporus TaxID=68256 RepID=A0ABP6TFA6_9ACTN|nr:hypothetical protein GCM10010332_57790 [Streptomyces albogriseolus]
MPLRPPVPSPAARLPAAGAGKPGPDAPCPPPTKGRLSDANVPAPDGTCVQGRDDPGAAGWG